MAFGIEQEGGEIVQIIAKGTFIPTTKTLSFATTSDYQSSASISIYLDEHAMTKDNYKLCTVTIRGIPPAPAGVS